MVSSTLEPLTAGCLSRQLPGMTAPSLPRSYGSDPSVPASVESIESSRPSRPCPSQPVAPTMFAAREPPGYSRMSWRSRPTSRNLPMISAATAGSTLRSQIVERLVAVHLREQILLADQHRRAWRGSPAAISRIRTSSRISAPLGVLRARLFEFLADPHRLERQRLRFHRERERISVAIGDRPAHRRIDDGRRSLVGRLRRQCRRVDALNPQQLQRSDTASIANIRDTADSGSGNRTSRWCGETECGGGDAGRSRAPSGCTATCCSRGRSGGWSRGCGRLGCCGLGCCRFGLLWFGLLREPGLRRPGVGAACTAGVWPLVIGVRASEPGVAGVVDRVAVEPDVPADLGVSVVHPCRPSSRRMGGGGVEIRRGSTRCGCRCSDDLNDRRRVRTS